MFHGFTGRTHVLFHDKKIDRRTIVLRSIFQIIINLFLSSMLTYDYMVQSQLNRRPDEKYSL